MLAQLGTRCATRRGVWRIASARERSEPCGGEGACAPGSEESYPCNYCGGPDRRVCQADCAWGNWEYNCYGTCMPGEQDCWSCGYCIYCGFDCNWPGC